MKGAIAFGLPPGCRRLDIATDKAALMADIDVYLNGERIECEAFDLDTGRVRYIVLGPPDADTHVRKLLRRVRACGRVEVVDLVTGEVHR